MGEIYTALGLMSGTSMDGVDASIIKSDGDSQIINILDEYFEFDSELHESLVNMRNLITSKSDLVKYSKELRELELKLTLFHSSVTNQMLSKYNKRVDLIGFHGQTIFHNPINKISKQLGDGKLLSQLSKKTVIYDFRKNDLENGGQGAPLTPIFHKLISNDINKTLKDTYSIINIGGITNITIISNDGNSLKQKIEAYDIGPGNCLIDEWIRKNSNSKYDKDGLIGKSGKINQLIFNQAIDNFNINSYDRSLDIKDFDISFAKGLSLEDGCATVTNFTAYLIAEGLNFSKKKNQHSSNKFLMCGGGRKNNFLVEKIKEYLNSKSTIILELIDDYDYNGDFIEAQAFGYLSIRSYLGLPISFPSTTGCREPSTGGIIIKNY